MRAFFVCVSVLQGRGELACALLEKLDCSVQKQRSSFVYKHNRRWLPIQPSSNRPLNKRLTHTFSHTHTNCPPVFLFVSHSHTHTHAPTNKQGAKFSEDGEPRLLLGDTLDSHCQDGGRTELGRKREPATQGRKTFSSVTDLADLVRTLTVYSDRRDSSVGRYHADIHRTWT